MLTDNEKAAIIKAHLRNIEANKYNVELSIKEENVLENPNNDVLTSLNQRISNLQAQIDSLEEELSKLNVTEENTSIPEVPISQPIPGA